MLLDAAKNVFFKKKGEMALVQTLIILIVVLALTGVIAYIIWSRIISGRVNPIE